MKTRVMATMMAEAISVDTTEAGSTAEDPPGITDIDEAGTRPNAATNGLRARPISNGSADIISCIQTVECRWER
jgi:hypothetical protein